MKTEIAIGVAALLFSLVGWGGYSLGQTKKQGEWDASIVSEQKGKDAALRAAAEAIAKIDVKSEQIIQPLRTEIRTNTVYRDCKHSPDGLRYLNDLIDASNTPGNSVLPQANKAK